MRWVRVNGSHVSRRRSIHGKNWFTGPEGILGLAILPTAGHVQISKVCIADTDPRASKLVMHHLEPLLLNDVATRDAQETTRSTGDHLNRKCNKVSKNLHRPPDATRHVAAAAAATHHPLKIFPHLFHHSKPATARRTDVTGPDLAPGAQDRAQLIVVSTSRSHKRDLDPVQPYEPLQDPVRLAKVLEQYLRR
ncbi:hypothetical protein HPB50_007605 [Hyalomma asiaticum]|uniref:Uncharacterized protein n=1 Tax=Hyalomma asiaticum TaxID=266040 RepID=A0ACB7RXG5_HYAAI|nr:hypothetical protein HPB50_007605 [Hyalomma asiaticum]